MAAEVQEKGSGPANTQMTQQVARFVMSEANCCRLEYNMTQSGGMSRYMKQRLIVVDERQLEP